MEVTLTPRRGEPIVVSQDEHPRPNTSEASLAKLRPIGGSDKSVTAGNASGVNDGSAALLLASAAQIEKSEATPLARVVVSAATGVAPRVMGVGPVEAVRKVLALAGLTLDQIDLIELNEAFASQSLACLRDLGLADDDARVNPNGGAIAMGHPLGMTGARLVLTAAHELNRRNAQYALCTMCVGVGQGTAVLLQRA